jgi:hypothetical protein
MRLSFDRRAKFVLFGLLTAAVIVSLAFHELHLYARLTFHDGLGFAYVDRWVTYAAAAGTLLASFWLTRGTSRLLSAVAALVFFLIYLLSIRSVLISSMDGEIIRYWAGFSSSTVRMESLNDRDYCYQLSSFRVTVNTPSTPEYTIIRGLWPATLSRRSIVRAMPFPQCPSR